MQQPISIIDISTISALGSTPEEVWQSYLSGSTFFSNKKMNDEGIIVSQISSEINGGLKKLVHSNSSYKNLDRSVLLGMLASRKLVGSEKFQNKNMGINIGSSRGATQLFEKYHQQFNEKGKVSPFASPTTTLGNISSWIGQDLGVDGIQIGHSVTCSTAMHAVLNGIAWLQADMADVFLVGGSESALTPFTIAQMKAMKLYSHLQNEQPCESLKFQKKKNTMILGEGAAVALLEKGISERTKAVISGYGFASEMLEHNSSISKDGLCFQKSMKKALVSAGLETVDAVVMHAPGTVKGDMAELNAINLVFKEQPLLTSNKWMLGHTFGASGMMSLEMAMLMLEHSHFIDNPFYKNESTAPKKLKTIMINAVGFGGNAVSIILTK